MPDDLSELDDEVHARFARAARQKQDEGIHRELNKFLDMSILELQTSPHHGTWMTLERINHLKQKFSCWAFILEEESDVGEVVPTQGRGP